MYDIQTLCTYKKSCFKTVKEFRLPSPMIIGVMDLSKTATMYNYNVAHLI